MCSCDYISVALQICPQSSGTKFGEINIFGIFGAPMDQTQNALLNLFPNIDYKKHVIHLFPIYLFNF